MESILNKHIEMVPNMWTGEEVPTISYDHIYVASPGDWAEYQVIEIPPAEFESMGLQASKSQGELLVIPGAKR